MSRIAARFEELRRAQLAAFIPFITAGDPDGETSFAILERLPGAGADLIELGVPFSDPMADGPAIQAASQRAIASGMTLSRVLELVRRFRRADQHTPLILMGYYNPIHAFGTARFAREAASAGVDGLIVVDLPPEEDEVLRAPAAAQELDVVRLASPTADAQRLGTILRGAGGFVYYVSIAGVTGTKSVSIADVGLAVERIRAHTPLPCAVGFGIRTAEQAAEVARIADAAVVGSAIVARIAAGGERRRRRRALVKDVTEFCAALSRAVHGARAGAAN
ncbi:MAG: tryptophan synthase subunit alpha [Rhizomicrobium sp.]